LQPEQSSNFAAIERKGFAIRIPKSKDPSNKIHKAIQYMKTLNKKQKSMQQN